MALRPSCRALVLLSACALAAPALAGPRPYAFNQGFDALEPAGLELESWFTASKPGSGGPAAWDWWLGPSLGLSDRVEVSFFAVFEQSPDAAAAGAISLASLRPVLSVQLAEKRSWPVDVRLRAEVAVPVGPGRSPATWVSAIVSRDQGPVNLTANLGGAVEWQDAGARKYANLGFGASVALGLGLRAGVETTTELSLGGSEDPHPYAGLLLAWGAGRAWTTLSLGTGLFADQGTHRGRIVLGLAF